MSNDLVDESQVVWDDDNSSDAAPSSGAIDASQVVWDDEPQSNPLSGRLESMHKASTDTPEDVAKWDGLAKQAGVSYNVAKTIPDQVEKKLNPTDWDGFAADAPKTAQFLSDNPRVFEKAKGDIQALRDIEKARTAGSFAHDLGIRAIQGVSLAGQSVIGTTDMALKLSNPIKAAVDLALDRESGTLSGLLSDAGISFNKANEAADALVSDASKQDSADVNAAFDDGLVSGGRALVERPAFIAEKVVQSAPQMLVAMAVVRQRASQILAEGGEAALKAAMPELAKLSAAIEGAQTAGNYAGEKAEDGDLAARESLAAAGQFVTTAAIGQLSNKIGGLFGIDDVEAAVASGIKNNFSSVTDYLSKLGGTLIKEGPIEEGMQSATEQGWANFGDGQDLLQGTGRAFVEGSVVGAAQGGTLMTAKSGVDAVSNLLRQTQESADRTANDVNALDAQIDAIAKTKLAQLDKEDAVSVLNNMDGGEIGYVYVDSALFHTGVVTKDVFLKAAPSAADQIDQAMETGGLIRMPRNELLVGLSQNADIRNDVMAHVKSDVFGDTQSELGARQSELDKELEELANKAISMAKDKAKAADDLKDVAERFSKQFNETGYGTQQGNKKRAFLWAVKAMVIANQTGLSPMEAADKYFGRLRNKGIGSPDNVFNQEKVADFTTLEKAKADVAAGIDPVQVQQETGWQKDDDGLWRFYEDAPEDVAPVASADISAPAQPESTTQEGGASVVGEPVEAQQQAPVVQQPKQKVAIGEAVPDDQVESVVKREAEKQNARLFQGGDDAVPYNTDAAPTELSDEAADDLVTLYQELGSDDDNFQYARKIGDDLDADIISALPEGTVQTADEAVIMAAQMDAEDAGAPDIVDVKKYSIPTKELLVDANDKPILKDGKKQYTTQKRDAFVYINDAGEYWTDISNLKRAGGVGGIIYTKVADFAEKNGGVFRGDPLGLSDDALLKRTEHMASGIARRKDTGRFIPHERQLTLIDKDHATSPLNTRARAMKWVKGNDTINRREIVKTAFHNITQVMPELRHAWIDPDTGRILVRGTPLNAEFDAWVHELQTLDNAQDGQRGEGQSGSVAKQREPLAAYRHLYASASIKRQLLANTLARYVGESAERRRQILDRLGEISKDLESYDGRKLFYQSKNAKPFDGKESDRARIAKRDAEYMAAVERGDMEAAQKLVNEAAAEAGYDPSTSERMSHAAPNSKDGMSVNLADVRGSDLVPEDFWTHPKRYASDNREISAHRKVMDVMRRVERKRAGEDVDTALTVYRAIPKNAKDTKMRNGDWVSPLRSYAEDEGLGIQGGYKIIAETVDAAHLYFNGDSIAELGFDNGKGYAYKNTKNNRKLADAVTRDEDGNIVPLSKRFNPRKEEEYFQDKDSPRGFFDPSTRDITMLAKADLSTFLHETGHLFLEIQAELALDENASERMKSDMDSVLKWFGVEGETAQDRLKNWHAMPFEQKRPLHEKYAESFEQYLFEGKAPSAELNEAFQTFKAWLSHVYTSIKNFLSESGQNADLNDEIRSVFDRMLATEEQIAQAQQTAGMMPMYASRPEGVSDAEWDAYQQAADEYVQAATEQLSGRALRDLKWVKNAVGTKGKIMREMRREAAALRREARMEARTRFLSRPIVQAYQFLTAPVEGVKARNKRARNSEHVDTARDSLFTAIAKLGGLNKAEAESTYGLDPKAFLRKGGVFGKPVLRKEGGMSLDAMSEALSQYNYLPLDEHGKWGIHDLGDLLLEEAAGNPQYSTDVDMDVLLGEPQRAFFDAENVEYMGGRLNRIDIRNMFDDIQLAEMAGIDPFSGEKVADSAVLQGYNQKRKVEGGGNERQYVLFDEPGNDNAADKKRARRKGAPRNMESAERVPGRYTTTVKSEKTKEINAGFDLLDTPAKVAFATSSLSKSPQEVLFAVATDKNDKPIAILRHSLGMRDSASVDPGIVAGWAANVEGAANLWLSHNHPSGKSDLGNADKNISKIIGDILDGTGITNRGIIAVTHEGNYSWADTSGSDEAGSIPEPEKSKKVSVVEREFSSNGLLSDDYSDGVNNPADAIKMAKDIGGGEAGIVMLDAQYRPIGFMPINYTEANNARGKKLHKDIVRAIELSNANTVLHYSPDSGRAVEDGMLNIGALMDVANIKTIDAIVGGNTSLAGRDGILSSNTFQQNKKKKNKDPNAHRTLESMGVLSDDGIPPELVAGYFGMETEQLIRGLLDTHELGNIKQAIENMTDQIMLERHADLATPEAIAEATLKAVMNKARAKFVATEYAILAKATGSERVLQRQAKDYAGRVIGATKVKDVKPEKFIAAAAKAGKEAQKAMAKSDTKAALLAKRNQVLNEATAKLAVDVKEEIDKFDDLAAKIIKATNEKNAKRGRDPDVVNAITAVMGFYGFYPSRQQNAMEYLERVREHDPDMFLRLQDAVNRAAVNQKDFNDLTINEMRGLREEIEGLWYTAKRSRQMEIDGKKIDLQEAADGLVTRLLEVGLPDEKLGAKNAPTEKDLLTHKLKTAGAWLTRVEQWAERMDGQWGGAFTRYIFQPVKKAADRYRTEATEYNRRYVALIDALPKMKRGLIAAPELGYTFGAGDQKVGMAELLHAVLHTGNASNKRKLLLGRGWAVLREDGSLDTARWDVFVERMHKQGVLKKEHYDFAQGVWDLLEDTKAGAQKTHRDVFGYYFAEVTADAFDTPFGSYRGGYVPAQADPRLVVDAAQRAMAEEENNTLVNAFPATAKGFTKGRTEYNKPLMLDLQSLAQHINKVLLFTHMEPAVRDVKKLLMRNDVAETLGAVDRAAYDSMLTPWLSVAARQSVNTPVTGDAGISNAVNIARNNTGMALMAANLSNAMQQITGFLTATQKVQGKYMLRETASFLARPKEYANEVRAASEYMAVRMDAEIHAINSQINELLIAPTAYQKTKAFAARHAYFLQAMMDNTMSPIIWRATFNQGVEQGMTDADAEQYANATIRQTQGSSLPEDVSRVEVGGAFWRATMQFYGYFNSMVNTNVVAVKNAKTKSEAMGHIIYGAILPAIVAQSIAVAMRGGVDDDDYDGWLDDWITEVAGTGLFRYATAMVPVVGAFANLAVGYTTKTPVDDRMQTSATTSMIGSALRAVDSVPDAITGDGKPSKAIKDVAAGISLFTGLPVFALARPVGYAADVAAGEVVPTSGGDMTRGLLTGTASPDSK